jgi:hypothetical protein
MKYTSYPHYFAERVDRVLETREKFRELYLSYTATERYSLLNNLLLVTVRSTPLTFVCSDDSVIVNPTDEEIDMIWWELVKNGFREFVYAKEIPNGIAAMTRNFLSGKPEFGMPCMSVTVDSVLKNPEKYRCDEREKRNRKRGNTKPK